VTTFDPDYFPDLVRAEESHFWFTSRNQVIRVAAERAVSESRQRPRVLEVGCGTGNVLRMLDAALPQAFVLGMDLFIEGLKLARVRTDRPLVQGDLEHAPFNARFDIIGLFDVLEHLPDDVAVLTSLRATLAPRGFLLLTVPAGPRLWSYFDEAANHKRRYTLDDLHRKLVGSGFVVEYLTHYMAALLPLMWAGRRWSARRRTDGRRKPDDERAVLARAELAVSPAVSAVLRTLMAWEPWAIAARRRLPWGTSLLAVARPAE